MAMRAGRFLTAFMLVLGACAPSVWAADNVTEAKSRLLDSIKYLASDDLEGRGVGTEGLNKAAEFVRQQFAAAGLDVTRVKGGAFQTFDLVSGSKLNGTPTIEFLGPEGKTITLTNETDFQACSFAGSGEFDADIVFCGYGIEAKDDGYDDFAGIDVQGKVVIIMRRNPGQGQKDGKFSANGPHGISRHAELRTKMSQATQHGAVAVLFVNDPYATAKKAEDRQSAIAAEQATIAELADALLSVDKAAADKVDEATKKLAEAVTKWKDLKSKAKEAAGDDELMQFGYAGYGEGKAGPPGFHITQAQANAILKPALGKTLAELEKEIDADGKPKSAVLPGWRVRGKSTVERVRTDVSNVIGVLEGTGPSADETIVIGAHYDHVGRGGPNSLSPGSTDIHNGADDNASGTVALLELARRLAARPDKLPRRLVFMAFTGEELGLLGSARYVKEPVFPLENTIAMFNMDMVGRLKDDKLIVYGTATTPRWEPELKALNERAKFQLSFKPEGIGPSDHSSFYEKKIPVLHFFTGNHPDYHRPSDDWDKINFDGMLRVVDLLEPLVVQTATNPERPAYVEVKQPASAQRGGGRPYFGTIPDFGSEGEGYAIGGAAPGSPADKGGLKGGDRIVKIGDNRITGLDDFDLALRKFKAGEEVTVLVLRDGKEVALKVTLARPRQ
jgi:hypothetical protein